MKSFMKMNLMVICSTILLMSVDGFKITSNVQYYSPNSKNVILNCGNKVWDKYGNVTFYRENVIIFDSLKPNSKFYL